MKVKELIKMLKEEDPEREVIMSKDREGNDYSPLSDFGEGTYVPDSTWSGDIYIEELTEELEKEGFTEEDLGPLDIEGRVKALILYPIN